VGSAGVDDGYDSTMDGGTGGWREGGSIGAKRPILKTDKSAGVVVFV